ncbi:MAG: zinc-dependent metalloprotease [Planctomycetes bacterium]|nr:zinc-dependent metalloprotease [Planctomycetota bacterium]
MSPHGPSLWFLLACSVPVACTSTHVREDATVGAREQSASTGALPAISVHTKRMERVDGFFPLFVDRAGERVFLEIGRLGEEFLYVPWLATGLGSNPVGLDRGLGGGERVVRFERHGPQVLLVQDNLRYRARTDDDAERATIRESFATSTLWGGEVVAADGERILIDATSLVMRDAAGVVRKLKAAGQGAYRVDASRSAFYWQRTRGFPRNTEIEVSLTFACDAPGAEVRRVAPEAEAITLRQHHSFVALPDDGYTPRVFHPRSGSFPLEFFDYAAPLAEPMRMQWIQRHRLEKAVPGPAPSRPVEPIVYWLDAGTPEPVRTALLEGARWWKDAFAAAGFVDAFEVRMLPPDADPLDVRYNVIQWVHRATRGWSYGRTISDPRTGEIVKGHVTLGSLRVRQDHRIFVGSGAETSCCDAASGGPAISSLGALARLEGGESSATELSLARLRQLAAHEVGHTLGFAHNFAASVHDRASVMDYPAPLIRIVGDKLDFSGAYTTSIGAWDVLAVRYAYTQFLDAEDERIGLREILREARTRGIDFLTDQDARDVSAAHPAASLWDNGDDAIRELSRVLDVREHAMSGFSSALLEASRPQSELEELFVPIYLLHRYQIEACAKQIGGLRFDYSDAGEERRVTVVPHDRQLRAIAALMDCLQPARLRVPDKVLGFLVPPAFGTSSVAERFPRYTGGSFEEAASARVVADLVFDAVLDPRRCSRLEDQAAHARAEPARDGEDPQQATLAFDRLLYACVVKLCEDAEQDDARDAALRRAALRSFADHVFALCENARASPGVREASAEFVGCEFVGSDRFSRVQQSSAFVIDLAARARRFLQRMHERASTATRLEAPPGSPIGDGSHR